MSATIHGLLAEFPTDSSVLRAARKVREAGYQHWDVHTPYPVHGIDRAMGVRATVLPWIVLAGGVVGAALGYGMQYWMNAVDYPFLVSGKPFHSIPSQIPVTFELTILFSAFAAVFGCLALNRLPRWVHPVHRSETFRRATIDRFIIVIEARDPRFSIEETSTLLRSLEPTALEILED